MWHRSAAQRMQQSVMNARTFVGCLTNHHQTIHLQYIWINPAGMYQKLIALYRGNAGNKGGAASNGRLVSAPLVRRI